MRITPEQQEMLAAALEGLLDDDRISTLNALGAVRDGLSDVLLPVEAE